MNVRGDICVFVLLRQYTKNLSIELIRLKTRNMRDLSWINIVYSKQCYQEVAIEVEYNSEQR